MITLFTDEEVKDLLAINFSESIREEQNLRKVAKSLLLFLIKPDKVQSNYSDNCMHLYHVENLNPFDPESKLKDTESAIENKLKELLSKFKKSEVETISFLGYKKGNNCKIFHSCTKLIASNLDLDKSFKSMHQRVITKIKNYTCEDWIVLDAIIKHSL